MPRAIASLSLSFGLVSIPVKLYSATESSSAIRFKWMTGGGSRVRQQFVSEAPPEPTLALPGMDRGAARVQAASATQEFSGAASPRIHHVSPCASVAARPAKADVDPEIEESTPVVVERRDMLKGYEFEKGKFVLFSPDELKALEQGSRQTIDIISFVSQASIDPIYYDKAYFLAPDKRGNKPYSLLLEAMRTSGRCALAKWAWRSKQYVVQVRPAEGGMVLQQLLYAEEVRSMRDLKIDLVEVSKAELQLALQLIEQISEDAYDPTQFVDEEKQRILQAVEKKIAGNEIVAPEHVKTGSAQVIDLMAALRASLSNSAGSKTSRLSPVDVEEPTDTRKRKPARRAAAPTQRTAKKATGKK